MFDSNVTLQAARLIALADLPPVIVRTTLSGTASYCDTLVLVPSMHQQQTVSEINHGKFPITGAMTTGYVFCIENPATVHYLQISLALIQDWWALGVLGGFMVSWLLNVIVIKWRYENGWKGKKEPDIQGNLFILLCHDCWVRLQGAVDDLKAVASGQWLHDLTALQSFSITCTTMLVYVSAALAFNALLVRSLLIRFLLLSMAVLLTLCNSLTGSLQMCDRVIWRVGAPKKYEQRLVLANELITDMGGQSNWAIGMGLVLPKSGEAGIVNV
ncbi:uncharacterized protein ARMOST_19053 [Armillaria ostoyae]|uniref:Uncharacterized protein n=1 Tax=Armillaria ostoyae TaxID=47428 RepID=A0A284S3F8_ARMOS|nr:uncharacterized protein ARMOST_19053 [Armillaria ostoyae]